MNLYASFLKEIGSESTVFQEALTRISKLSEAEHFLMRREVVKKAVGELQANGAFVFVVAGRSLKGLRSWFSRQENTPDAVSSYVHLISQCHKLHEKALFLGKRVAVVVPVMSEHKTDVLIVVDSGTDVFPLDFAGVASLLAKEVELPYYVKSVKLMVLSGITGTHAQMFDISAKMSEHSARAGFSSAFSIPESLSELVSMEPLVFRLPFSVDKWPIAKRMLTSREFTVEYDPSLQIVLDRVVPFDAKKDQLRLVSIVHNYRNIVQPALQELFPTDNKSVEAHILHDLSNRFAIEFHGIALDRVFTRKSSTLRSRLCGLPVQILPETTGHRTVRSVIL